MIAPTSPLTLRLASAGFGLLLAVVIAACGGAIGSGGTGAAPPAVSGGTVTGFGSVIIDGLRFDDRGIATVAETAPGRSVPAETRLGHRVEVELDAAGTATALRVEASVVGAVTGTSITAGQAGIFVVLGQTVSVNGDPAAGPVTQFGGGYANALDLRVGDAVEIHGVSRIQGSLASLQATRIEKLPALPAYLRVGGVVSALGEGAAQRFALGSLTVDYGSATVTPGGAGLANGVPVLVFAPAGNLQSLPSGGPLLGASEVRIKTHRNTGADIYASGFIAALNHGLAQFELNGVRVSFPAATVRPAGTLLANGQYVQVRGTLSADGSLAATQVTLRDGKSEPEAELKGTVVAFNVASGTFQVRDVVVALGSAELQGCPAAGLRDGLFVELEGLLGPTGVIAKKIECKEEPASAVIEREGVAGAVDPAASSFTLTASGKAPIAVTWTTTTYFGNVTPQTLAGKSVEVEGTLVNGTLQATKIKADL